ncbi:MAG: Rho termination factor N-terminal domain-containing protein [Promethearchaeota archaeon]
MTEYEHFMVYELDDSGERLKLNIDEAQLEESLHPEQVLVIVKEDLRRIFIWKGGKSSVRKRFISSRVAQTLQEELMKDSRYHRCKIVSVDAGDEPSEFLNAFGLESMVVTERLADMRYIRNIERERMEQAAISDISPKVTTSQSTDEYFSPALQDTSNEVVVSSYARTPPSPKAGTYKQPMVQLSAVGKATGLSDEQKQIIKNRILKTDVSNGYKRLNLILGHSLYAAVSKSAKVFGKEVEETDWEPVKKVPKDMLELDHHILRVYFDEKKGIVEAIEVLEKEVTPKSKEIAKETESSKEKVDFNSMTVKDLKAYAEEKKIDLPSNAKKAEIIEILEQANQKNPNSRRQLPKIPSNDD